MPRFSRSTSKCAFALGALASTVAGSAHATEGQLQLGGTVSYVFVDQGNRFDALSITAEAHYGLTDAIDLSGAIALGVNPGQNQVSIVPEIGVGYVVDITRFLPRVGVRLGFADVATYACPAETNADGSEAPPTPDCGHELHPVVAIPASLDFRVVDGFWVGAHFRYAWLLFGDPINEISLGGFAGYTF